jgi:hypothetical protein
MLRQGKVHGVSAAAQQRNSIACIAALQQASSAAGQQCSRPAGQHCNATQHEERNMRKQS